MPNDIIEERYIYVIAASTDGPVKLGISGQPEKRMRQLQTGHAGRLRLFHVEAVAGDRATLLERLLHRDLGYLRQHGEWFTVTVPDAIRYVQCTIIDYALEADLRRCLRQRRW